jgi:hypothetical protein
VRGIESGGGKPRKPLKKKPPTPAPRRGGAADTWKQPGYTPPKSQTPTKPHPPKPHPSEVKDVKSDADRKRAEPTVRRELKLIRQREAARKEAARINAAAKGRTLTVKTHRDSPVKDVAHAADNVLRVVYPRGKKGGKGAPAGSAVSSVPMVATGGPARRAKNIGTALYLDPVGVPKNTIKSLPSIAAGAVGATGSIINDAAHGRATTLKKLPGEAAKGYKRRYGASDAEQIRQIRKEGAASDVSDAAAVLGGGGAVIGRALTPIAKTGALGEKAAKVASEARPKLRVLPGEGGAKTQPKSKNLFVAGVQDARDQRRAKKIAKQQARHEAEGTPVRGVVPEGPDEVVRTSLRRQRHEQHKATAGQVSRGHIRLKNKQDREVRQGIERERRTLRKATPKNARGVVADAEQLALEGHINFDDVARTRELLTARRAAIVSHRAEHKTKVPKTRGKSNDDLARIDRVLKALDENPSSVLSPALRDFHAKQVDRYHRLRGDEQIVDALTADVRRYMPLARTTGDAKAFEAKVARIEEKHANGDFGAPESSTAAAKANELVDRARTQFVATVKAKATHMGVGEPVYVLHRPRPTAGYADYAAGGSRAVAGPKKTSYKLHDTGTQDVTPGAYTQGVAKTIKRNVNWNTVADVLERNAVPWSRGTAGGGRTVEKLRQEIDTRGLDERDWAVVDLGVYRKNLEAATVGRGDDLISTGEAGLHDALTKATYDLAGAESQFVRTNRRFVVVPRAVANELRDMTKPAGTIRRGAQKFQGWQSRVLLNLNPTFVPIQVIGTTPLAIYALRGNVKDLLAAQGWYKDLDTASRDVVDERLGISPARSATQSPRLGAASPDNRLIRFFQAVVDSDRAQRIKGSWANPLNWNPIFDDAQNGFFRKAVFYNQAKRQAAQGMGRSADAIRSDAAPLIDILKMPAGEAKIRALRRAEPQIEQVAQHVDDWLGNYLRFTARERQYLKTALLFYGFLRWSLKFTLYTLPVKHPIATSILAKLGELHNDEVIDLLALQAVNESGGRITKEQAADELRKGGYSGVFGRVWIASDGKLKSIDLQRVNPFTNALAGVLDGGVRALPGLLSPALQAVSDLAYGRSAFQDRPLNFGGKDVERAADITLGQGARYVGRTLARTAFPIRAADNILNPGSQSDDSLPVVGDRPRVPQTDTQAKREAQKVRDKGPFSQRLASQVLPLQAKPDNTARGVSGRVLHERMAALDARKNQLEQAGKKFRPGSRFFTPEYQSLLDEEKRLRTTPGETPKKVVRGKRYLTPAQKFQKEVDDFRKQANKTPEEMRQEVNAYFGR